MFTNIYNQYTILRELTRLRLVSGLKLEIKLAEISK